MRRLLHAALGHAQALFDHAFEWILGHVGAFDHPLRAALHIGDQHRRASRLAFGIEGVQDVEFHFVFLSFRKPSEARLSGIHNPCL